MCSFVRKHLFVCQVNIFLCFFLGGGKFLISFRNPIMGDLTALYINDLPRNIVPRELILMILIKGLL